MKLIFFIFILQSKNISCTNVFFYFNFHSHSLVYYFLKSLCKINFFFHFHHSTCGLVKNLAPCFFCRWGGLGFMTPITGLIT